MAARVNSPAVAFSLPASVTTGPVAFASGKDAEKGRWITVGEGADAHHLFIPQGQQRVHGSLEHGETFAGHAHTDSLEERPSGTFRHDKSGKALTVTRVNSWRGMGAADREEAGGKDWHHDFYARPATRGEAASLPDHHAT
jgi:hypothetical protein